MKREFDSASRTPAPDIATKAELDQRLANRPTLTPQQVQDDIKEAQSNIRRFALAQRATMTDLEYKDPE